MTTVCYDLTILSLRGLPAWGWDLKAKAGAMTCVGVFIAAYDSDRTDYAAVGKTGSAEAVTLMVAQMPKHRHRIKSSTTDSQLGGGNPDWTRLAAGNPNARPKSSSDDANFTEYAG